MQGDTQTVKTEPNFGLKYIPTYSTMYATQEQLYDFDDIYFFFFLMTNFKFRVLCFHV